MKIFKIINVLALFFIKTIFANNTVFQVSTGNAMISGLYQGAIDFKTLSQHGDFGLGSVEGMNGELIAIDGKFYRIAPDGKMNIIKDEEQTPYAIVTHFKSNTTFEINNIISMKSLVNAINKKINNRNIPYAIHIHGNFDKLTLRAVKGAKPPYPEFSEIVKKQAIFTLNDVGGDGVGFFYPIYLSKVNTPGYHIHFITHDKKTGGHILEIKAKRLTIELMPMDELTIAFPHSTEFSQSPKLKKDYMPMMIKSFGDGIQQS